MFTSKLAWFAKHRAHAVRGVLHLDVEAVHHPPLAVQCRVCATLCGNRMNRRLQWLQRRSCTLRCLCSRHFRVVTHAVAVGIRQCRHHAAQSLGWSQSSKSPAGMASALESHQALQMPQARSDPTQSSTSSSLALGVMQCHHKRVFLVARPVAVAGWDAVTAAGVRTLVNHCRRCKSQSLSAMPSPPHTPTHRSGGKNRHLAR